MREELVQRLCQTVADMRDVTPEDERKVTEMIDNYISCCGTDPLVALSAQTTQPFKTSRFGATILHVVCELGMIGAFDHILTLCSDPAFLNLRMDDGATALFVSQLARLSSNKDGAKALYMATRLVESGADCFITRTTGGATPLYCACEAGFLDAAKFMLSVMLAARGVTDRNRTDEAVRDVVYKEQGAQSLLHAAVCSGHGNSVCRWLTSPECALLWPGRDLRTFVDYKPPDYPYTAFYESAATSAIDMPTVRYLHGLGTPLTAVQLVDSVLGSSSTRSDSRRTSLEKDVELIEYMYEKASALPDFAALRPSQTLCRVIGWLGAKFRSPGADTNGLDEGCSVAKAQTIADLVVRLTARYPQLFTADHVSGCKKLIVDVTKTWWGRRRGEASRVSVMIMLDAYPFDSHHLRMLVNPSRLGPQHTNNSVSIDGGVFSHYARQFLARTDCGEADEQALCDLMDTGHSAAWPLFVADVQARHPDPRAFLRKMTSTLLKRDREGTFDVEHVRFILWARENKLTPSRFRFDSVLYRCASAVAPALFKYLMRSRARVRATGVSGFVKFSSPVHPTLLYTMMWNTSMRPTQVLARMYVESMAPLAAGQRVDVVRRLKWICNLRHMIRDRDARSSRIVLGPKTGRPASPLPAPATHALIELLWEGKHLDLTVTGLAPVDRQRTRSS